MKEPKCTPETSDARQLEGRRVTRAFDEIRRAWWWFEDSARPAHAENPAAWQWELLRRSQTYRAFYAKADAIRIPDSASFFDSATGLATLRSLAGSYSRLGASDPCHRWADLFFARCAPDFCWEALPEKSHVVIGLASPLYPRAEVAAAFTSPGGDSIQVEPIIVKRLSSGQEELTSLAQGPSTVILGRYEATQLLPAILPANSAFGVYIVVMFDIRNAEFTLTRLREEPSVLSSFSEILQKNVTSLQTWLRDTDQTAPTPCPSLKRVAASNVPYWCQAWIPTDAMTNMEEDILARFRTLINSRSRRRWLPGCKKIWGKLFPSFSAVSIAPLQAKRAWIKDKRDLQAGLCAYDCRQIETRFTQRGLRVTFLKQHPYFQSLADPDRLHDVRLQIKRLIEDIDAFYARRPAS